MHILARLGFFGMIDLIDKLFISLGFDQAELKASVFRGWLYAGMIYCLGIITAFLIVLILS